MRYVTHENYKLGEKVLIPINGEWMQDGQIMCEYEIVLAFKCKVPEEEQIVGEGRDPLPQLMEFHDDIAYKFAE